MATPSLEREVAWEMRSALLLSVSKVVFILEPVALDHLNSFDSIVALNLHQEPSVPTRALGTPSKDPYLISCLDMLVMPPPERLEITLVTSILLAIRPNRVSFKP